MKLPSLGSHADVTKNISCFAYVISRKQRAKQPKKNTGCRASIQLKMTCKISGTFAKKKEKHLRLSLAWFCSEPFNCNLIGQIS